MASPPVEADPRSRPVRAGGVRSYGGSHLRQAGAVLQRAAMLAVLLLSPSTYAAPSARRAFALRVYVASTKGLLSFLLLSAGLSAVLVLLVRSTAQNYGLSQVALEGIVRVLVLELIPLMAAVFVLVEVTVPGAALLSVRRARGRPTDSPDPPVGQRRDTLRPVALPHALAGMVAPMVLCLFASWVALALGYLMLYGITPWALPGFARVLGNVVDPVLAIVWSLKTVAFSVTVSLLPIAAALAPAGAHRVDPVDFALTTLVRIGALLLLIELLALLAVYA